jgi:hypothetical protein
MKAGADGAAREAVAVTLVVFRGSLNETGGPLPARRF